MLLWRYSKVVIAKQLYQNRYISLRHKVTPRKVYIYHGKQIHTSQTAREM